MAAYVMVPSGNFHENQDPWTPFHKDELTGLAKADNFTVEFILRWSGCSQP